MHETRLETGQPPPLLVRKRRDQRARGGVRVGATRGQREARRLVDRREAIVEVEQPGARRGLQWRNPKTK